MSCFPQDLSKIEAGHLEIEARHFDPCGVISSLAEVRQSGLAAGAYGDVMMQRLGCLHNCMYSRASPITPNPSQVDDAFPF